MHEYTAFLSSCAYCKGSFIINALRLRVSDLMRGWMERVFRRTTRLSVAEAYARWAPNYPPSAHNRLMELEERAVLEVLPEVRGRAALDLACGSGRYLKLLLERGASPAIGLDASAPMLSRARAVSPNVIRADLLALSLHGHLFQTIVCGLAMGHVRDLQTAIGEISRVLVPGGILVYSDFHPIGSWLGWKRTFCGEDRREYEVTHHTHYYSDHVAACNAAGLRIEDVREPRIDFGNKWLNCPALLVIRARKPD
jgi:malonyl-CoA O-methyltransferase